MKKLIPLSAGFLAYVVMLAPALAQNAEPPATQSDQVAQNSEVAQVQEPVSEALAEGEAPAEVAINADEEAEKGTLISPFSVSFGITDSFTLGSVFRDEYTTTDYNLMVFTLSGRYATPIPSLSVYLNMNVSKFLTEAGGSQDQYEARFGDISLGAAYGSIYQDERFTGINLSGSLGFRLPTSEVSRFTNLRTSARLGIGLSRTFGDLSLSYNLGVGKNFHRDTTVVADLQNYRIDVIARDGGRENIGQAQVALDTGVLAEWSVSNSLSLSYNWFPGFSTSLSWGISDTFTYDNGTIGRDDELTSDFAEPGRGHAQFMSGDITASYAFFDYFSASLTMSTTQPPKTADNQHIRFPWFDLETGNLSNTELIFSLAASY